MRSQILHVQLGPGTAYCSGHVHMNSLHLEFFITRRNGK